MSAISYEYRYRDENGQLVIEQRQIQSEPMEDNAQAIRAKAKQALQVNKDFLALASPTNAQILAQVKNLTREATGLIRLELQALDSTDDT